MFVFADDGVVANMDENGRVGLLKWLLLYRGTKKVRIVVICQNQSSFISCFFTFEATSCIKQQVCQQGDHVCLSWTLSFVHCGPGNGTHHSQSSVLLPLFDFSELIPTFSQFI
jgi:hypothetical protein